MHVLHRSTSEINSCLKIMNVVWIQNAVSCISCSTQKIYIYILEPGMICSTCIIPVYAVHVKYM